jgi:hypothetical protein
MSNFVKEGSGESEHTVSVQWGLSTRSSIHPSRKHLICAIESVSRLIIESGRISSTPAPVAVLVATRPTSSERLCGMLTRLSPALLHSERDQQCHLVKARVEPLVQAALRIRHRCDVM